MMATKKASKMDTILRLVKIKKDTSL